MVERLLRSPRPAGGGGLKSTEPVRSRRRLQVTGSRGVEDERRTFTRVTLLFERPEPGLDPALADALDNALRGALATKG